MSRTSTFAITAQVPTPRLYIGVDCCVGAIVDWCRGACVVLVWRLCAVSVERDLNSIARERAAGGRHGESRGARCKS